jgi:hypothetical protein
MKPIFSLQNRAKIHHGLGYCRLSTNFRDRTTRTSGLVAGGADRRRCGEGAGAVRKMVGSGWNVGGGEGQGDGWVFHLRSIILQIARFDFDTDSQNVKVKLLCPGLVKDILWSPCKQPELFQGLKCKPGLLRC